MEYAKCGIAALIDGINQVGWNDLEAFKEQRGKRHAGTLKLPIKLCAFREYSLENIDLIHFICVRLIRRW